MWQNVLEPGRPQMTRWGMRFLCFLDSASLFNLVNKPTWCTVFLSMLISFLYTFRATTCPSSGEITVPMQRLALVTLCGWLSGMREHMLLHTRQSFTHNNKYQVSHEQRLFLLMMDPHSRPKHVQKRNRHTKKNCAPSWLYLQDYTGVHGQQNIKFC